jgi:deoxyribodipyrimidine photo-lyase
MEDCRGRFADRLGRVSVITVDALPDWRRSEGLEQIVTSYLPVGPACDALAKIDIGGPVRPYDQAAWPHATHGFFRFRKEIPKLLGRIKGLETV